MLSGAHAALQASWGGEKNSPLPVKQPSKRDNSFILSLLPLFNFSSADRGRVSHADFQRGTRSMGLQQLADDITLWDELTRMYGDGGSHNEVSKACVVLENLSFLVPLEPHLVQLMRAVVFAIDHVKTFAAKQMRRNEREVDSRTSRLVVRKRNEIMLPPFAAWREYMRTERLMRTSSKRVWSRFARREQREAYDMWTQQTRQQHRFRTFARRLLQRGQARAINTWIELVRKRQRLRSFGRRMLQRSLVCAINQWVGMAVQRRWLQQCGRRIMHRHLSRAWQRWQTLLMPDEERITALMSTAKFMAAGRHLGRAWRTWHEGSARHRASLNCMRRAILRITHRRQAIAYITWCDYVARRSRAIAASQRAGRHILHAEAGRAWRQWMCVVTEVAQRRRVCQRLFLRQQSRAWNMWAEAVAHAVHRHAIAARTVAHLLNAPLSRAWSSWRLAAAQRAEQMTRYRSVLSPAAPAWRTWKAAAADARRRRRVCARLAHRPVARAWAQWCAALQDLTLLRRFVGRMSKRELALAFSQWTSGMSSRQRMQVFARRLLRRELLKALGSWSDVAFARQRLQAFARRLPRRESLRALHTWMAASFKGKHPYRRKKQALFVGRALQRTSLRAFLTWEAATSTRRMLNGLTRRFLTQRPGLGGWLRRWASSLIAQRHAARRRIFTRRLMRRNECAALRTWIAMVAELRRLRTFARRLIKQGLVRAINSWTIAYREFLRLRRAGKRLVNRPALRALLRWADEVAQSHRLRRRLQAFAYRMVNRATTAAYYTWVAAWRQRRWLQACVRRMKHRNLARALQAWLECWNRPTQYKPEELNGFKLSRTSSPVLGGPSTESKTSNPQMGKFVDAMQQATPGSRDTRFTLSFGDMRDFQRGLSGLVGPPAMGDAHTAMAAEHCARPDSATPFTVGNYGTTTTSEIEVPNSPRQTPIFGHGCHTHGQVHMPAPCLPA